MRNPPRPLTGLLVFLVYLTFFYGVWIVTSVDYNSIGDDPGTVLRWYVAPTWIGGAFLALAVTWLGWWPPVIRERERARPRWILVAPAFWLLLALLALFIGDYSRLTAGMLLLLLAGSLGVGFSEEIATRGVLLTGFRARFTEPWVWFSTCLLFGLLHLPNWFFGAGPSAAGQVLMAFGAGSTLYLLRRASGSLIWAMALHALWDFAVFAGEGSDSLAALVLLNAAIGIVVGAIFVRRERGQQIEQAGVPAPGDAPSRAAA